MSDNPKKTDRDVDEWLHSQRIPPLPAERLKQIESAVVAHLKPVKPIASDSVYLAGFVSVFLAACGVGCYLVGQYGWQALSQGQRMAVFVALAATTGTLVFSIVRQMRPAATYARSSAILSAGFFALLLLIVTVAFQPVQESAFVRHGLACFRTGMTSAIPAAFFFTLLLLRGAPLSPGLIGASAGGVAGLVGLTVLEIHCPNLNVYHIVVWHLSVTLLCALGGFAVALIAERLSLRAR
jgi:hypothetical protein